MRWSVFAAFAFLFLAVELSLVHVLRIGTIVPSVVAVLVVYVALFAPRATALWAAWLLGLLVDLSSDLAHGTTAAAPLLGPHALGYTFACYILLQLRAMLFRRRSLTIAIMTALCVAASNVVIVSIYVVHGWFPSEPVPWTGLSPFGELMRRIAIALYSGLLAMVVGPLLVWAMPIWSFRATPQRRAAWR